MDPSETAAHLPDPDRWQEPDALSEAAADLRVSLTTILGRSQLLERRIRTGRITDVDACLDTLAMIDAAVGVMTSRLHRLERDGA
jgi:signal transduction histidine kinase